MAKKKMKKKVFKAVIAESKNAFSVWPLGDRVVVKPITKDEVSSPSGIIIPDTVDKEKPEQGTVVAVGPGKHDDGLLVPMTVRIGDTVLFSKYGYDEVKVGGEEYFIIEESRVLAVLKK